MWGIWGIWDIRGVPGIPGIPGYHFAMSNYWIGSSSFQTVLNRSLKGIDMRPCLPICRYLTVSLYLSNNTSNNTLAILSSPELKVGRWKKIREFIVTHRLCRFNTLYWIPSVEYAVSVKPKRLLVIPPRVPNIQDTLGTYIPLYVHVGIHVSRITCLYVFLSIIMGTI